MTSKKKFKIVSSSYLAWDIIDMDSKKVVANITTFQGFRRNHKFLEIKGKKIKEITNQQQAIIELEKFYKDTNWAIDRLVEEINLLKQDQTLPISEYTTVLIDVEIRKKEETIKELSSYLLYE